MAWGKLNLTRRRVEVESAAFLVVAQPPDSRIGARLDVERLFDYDPPGDRTKVLVLSAHLGGSA